MRNSNQHTGPTTPEGSTWERVKDALRRDWDQTRLDFRLKFGQEMDEPMSDSPAPAAARERPADAPCLTWSDEDAVRFGYDAGRSAPGVDPGAWNIALEAALQREWEAQVTGRPWSDVRLAVRYGWARSRRGQGR